MTSITLNQESLYINQGNPSVLSLLDKDAKVILDVGCGAGNLGARIKLSHPDANIIGITCSFKEYEQAIHRLNDCICCDIERDSINQIFSLKFDTLIFSHVLEHLVDPVAVVQKLLPILKVGGKVIIALPNIANWRERWKLAIGRFEYTESGVMDKTHLHFYTYHTAPRYLIEPIEHLKLEQHFVSGSVPLGFLRHSLLPGYLRKAIDESGCRYMPNLFGGEILLKAIKI